MNTHLSVCGAQNLLNKQQNRRIKATESMFFRETLLILQILLAKNNKVVVLYL